MRFLNLLDVYGPDFRAEGDCGDSLCCLDFGHPLTEEVERNFDFGTHIRGERMLEVLLWSQAEVEDFSLQVSSFKDVQNIHAIAIDLDLALGLARIWAAQGAILASWLAEVARELRHLLMPDLQFRSILEKRKVYYLWLRLLNLVGSFSE
jgi:hypothetical protein